MVSVVAYILMAVISTPAFVAWLFEKKKYANNKIVPIVLGFCLAIVWPLSLFALYMLEKKRYG